MMATDSDIAVVRDDIAEVKREVLLLRKDQQAHEERVEARIVRLEEYTAARFEQAEQRSEARFELAEQRSEARFEMAEQRSEARSALLSERMNTTAQELRALFANEIRRAITVQTLLQMATMVGLVWAARG